MVKFGGSFEPELNRRQYLMAAGAAATLGLAGCNEVTSYQFEATPVGLAPEAAEELVMAELGHDSQTRTFDLEVGEVSVTSHGTTYHRGPARGAPTLLEAFARRVNGNEGAGASRLLPGISIYSPASGQLFETIPPQLYSMLVPGRAFTAGEEGAIIPENVLVLMNPETEVELTEDVENVYEIPVEFAFPPAEWSSGSEVTDNSTGYHIGTPSDTVFVTVGPDRSFEGVFGQPAEAFDATEPMTWQEIDDELTDQDGATVFLPGDVAFQDSEFLTVSPDEGPYEGHPAPMGGATFGLGTLATPRAEVAGNPQNPWATEDLATLLERDDAQELLEGAGVSEADDIRWLAGPEEVDPERIENIPVEREFQTIPEILDQEAELRIFTGVVNSREDTVVNWRVVLHVARVEVDGDAVVASGAHRSLVPPADSPGVPDYSPEVPDYDQFSPWIARGAAMTTACFEQVAIVEWDDDK